MKSIICFGLVGVMAGLVCPTTHAEAKPAGPQIVSVEKIWDAGKHNAFTDLIRFKDQWFCTFREGDHHVGGDGRIRVIASRDGAKWESAALLEETGIDLRDPKLSLTPDKRLMLTLGGSVYEGKTLKSRQPRVSFSSDGRTWSAPQRALAVGDWLWRVTWHNDKAYGTVYTSQPGANEWIFKLVESKDGVNYNVLKTFDVPGKPNEATVRFDKKGNAIILLRREGMDKRAWIGSSKAPYTDWTWRASGMQVGGPNFIVLPNGSMVAGGREYHPAPAGAKMFIGGMTLDTVTPRVTLPSGGDCSYPGMVLHKGLLWVSYYASHEGKTSIYLAKVKL